MKHTLLFVSLLAISLACGCTGLLAQEHQTVVASESFEGIERFLPSGNSEKVKIPGRREQVLKAHQQQKRTWKNIGPGYVNVPVEVKLHGETITMLIDIGGLMQSTDGGKSWNSISYHLEGGITGRAYFDFDISPKNKDLIIIGGNLISKTTDGGKTWKEIRNGLPKSTYNTRSNGFGQVNFTADGSRLFTATGTKVFMPVGWERLLLTHYTHKTIYVSDDNAESFRTLKLDAPMAPIACLAPHPNNPDVLYASFKDGSFYMTQNAKAQTPVFHKQQIPDGYYVQDVAISPVNANQMRATFAQITTFGSRKKKVNAKIFQSLNCLNSKMVFKEMILKDEEGKAISRSEFLTIGFNPNRTSQIVVGSVRNDSILISEDDLATARALHLPQKFYADKLEGNFYGQIERVFFGDSPYAVVVSRIGSWITKDNFKTLQSLTMTYKDGFFGNTGISSPANINGMAITQNNFYFSAQDHRAWRSNGKDHTKWEKITSELQNDKVPQQKAPWGKLTWFWGIERIFASYDGQYVYINSYAWKHTFPGGGFWQPKKFFLSKDLGKTWQDMTQNLGKGDVYPGNSSFLKTLFKQNDSATQWFLFSDSLYFSKDGGQTFSQCNSPLFKNFNRDNQKFFSDIAYDAKHNILYLSAKVADARLNEKLDHALFQSKDMGQTWKIYNAGQNAISSLAV
ncbi:MAG: hypothetical protein JKX85_01440, partial [Phycisphaeraceae bacterium]|nr:hypothetical protein [Phycisphaeraceae bacterium]